MIVMVTIAHIRLILPNERGVQTLLTVLAKAQLVEDDNRWQNGGIKMSKHNLDVKFEPLPGFNFVKRREPDDVLTPEVMRPIRGALPAGPRPISGAGTVREITGTVRLIRDGGVS